jgi:sigma-B regulation protein RsbU (phosphoserine phosphatase)
LTVRACRLLVIVLAALAMGLPLCAAQAPVFDASHLSAPSQLNAKWLVHAGDDPAYAHPDFDDSHWTLFDPVSSHGSLADTYGKSRPQIIWYRLRVKVDPAQKDLALDEINLARAMEIYVNGERAIVLGRIDPFVPYTYGANIIAPISSRQMSTGTLVIAIRARIMTSEWIEGSAGYGGSNLRIGQYSVLWDEFWLGILGSSLLTVIAALLFTVLGVVALVLFFSHRVQTEYLWAAGVAALFLFQNTMPALESIFNIPLFCKVLIAGTEVIDAWVLGSLYFSFVHQRVGWRWRTYFAVGGLMQAASGIASVYYANNISFAPYLEMPVLLLMTVIIPGVLIYHWRKGNREAGILLIPVALSSLNTYALFGAVFFFSLQIGQNTAILWINRLQHFSIGPLYISSDVLGNMLFAISLGIIILLRSSRMSRWQAQLEAELEAAQQVQQLLVPEKTALVPGFSVEAVYLPAQQVGGDFFQVLPAGGGGLLVVVGDVAGKGLPAAMLVSTLVGSIRTAADDTHAPELVLHRLNERLVGRTQGGFATALAAYIAPNGVMTIANAGHLSPYLDGKEIELPGALPLGITSPIHYETLALQVPPGSRLTFYSDGVIEAQNSKGELFGFDRSRDVSTQPAEEIAETARRFGQEDDITVVTIMREHLAASAA